MIRKLVVVLLTGVMCLVGVTSALAVTYNEAPMLKTLVATGELPPVEQRLPEEPMVVEPIEEIGQYGGTAYTFTPTSGLLGGYLMGVESMGRIAYDGKTIVPNIAKSWEISEGGKVLTLYLRKGIKWSDGAPFTADDILFWYEDVLLNNELTPVKPKHWSFGGELMKVEKMNDYAVRLRFAKPGASIAIMRLSHYWGNQGSFYLPKHHLKQFHPSYTSKEKLEELVKEEGYDSWYKLFGVKKKISNEVTAQPVNSPTLLSFVMKKKKPGEWLLERNPYYWKVDPEGNQLPYIDRWHVTLMGDQEAIDMRVIVGATSLQGPYVRFEKYPLYQTNATKGGYRVLLWGGSRSSEVGLMLNQTHKDPVLRKIIQDLRFRIALSLAINREEMNQVLLAGLGGVSQITALPGTSYYEEEFGKAYIEYNPQKANSLLDEMGLDKRDKKGYRLRPDGKTLALTIGFRPGAGPKTPICELVKEYWEDIGIKTALKIQSPELVHTRQAANEHDVGLWHMDGCSEVLFPLTGSKLIPTDYWCAWGVEWGRWYTSGGKVGEEPPEKVKRLLEVFHEEIPVASTKEELVQLCKEILRSQAENLWAIGTITSPSVVIAKDNLRNVPEEGLLGWDWAWMSIWQPEQFFFKK